MRLSLVALAKGDVAKIVVSYGFVCLRVIDSLVEHDLCVFSLTNLVVFNTVLVSIGETGDCGSCEDSC